MTKLLKITKTEIEKIYKKYLDMIKNTNKTDKNAQ